MKMKLLSSLVASAAALVAVNAQAAMHTDAHGNVGYDTAAECEAAVHNGTARFYQSFTHKSPLIRKGESKVQTAKIRDLGAQYQHGACDLGVGHKLGRDGVSKALQGKYVPYSPDMDVNVYLDANGRPVRVTMQQCDNWFSDNAPRPVTPRPAPAPAPVVVEEPAPVVEPVVAAPVAAAAAGIRPYVFGTVGSVYDGVSIEGNGFSAKDNNTRVGGQVGIGAQFNNWLGAEAYYQGGAKHKYFDNVIDGGKVQNHTFGARATIGTNVTEKARVFGKVGVAGVKHKVSGVDESSINKTRARPTLGLGATYNLTDNLALRADYDHVFKHSRRHLTDGTDSASYRWNGSHYLGAGLQYTF